MSSSPENMMDWPQSKRDLFSGRTTCEALVRSSFARIENGKRLNAFLALFEERALAKAKSVDERIRSGNAGKLAGLVMAVKDNIAVAGEKLTCGSRMLESFTSLYDATVVERLEAEDAVILGKTNMDEFGMGSSNENSAFGPVLNPRDPSKVPGGSSGGSAAAVASGMVMAALGSDTGGSIRLPASFCGVTGLRPTYGRISRYGLVAFASSLDQIGILAESPQTASAVLSVIAGRDFKDSTSSDVPVSKSALKSSKSGLRIGIPREYFQEGLDPEVKSAVLGAIEKLTGTGASVVDVSLPHTEYGIATYYLICTAEASSNLARYDGVRYGLRSKSANLHSMYTQTREEGFGSEVKRRILLGTYVLSAGYYNAYYGKAQKVRTLIRRDFETAFEKCDVIIGPTSPTTAFGLGEKSSDPMAMYLSDVYTVTAPLAGLPALSIPVGNDKNDLPIGLQITGKAFCESELLGLAELIIR